MDHRSVYELYPIDLSFEAEVSCCTCMLLMPKGSAAIVDRAATGR